MNEANISYNDGDVMVFERLGDIVTPNGGKTQQWKFQNISPKNMVVLVVCYRGSVQLRLNGRDYETTAGKGIALLPSAVIERVMLSPDIHIRGFCFAVTAMESMFHTYRQTWEEALSLNDHPQVVLTEGQMQVAENLYQIAKLEQQMTDTRYYRPMMRSLVQSMLYMLADVISSPTEDADNPQSTKEMLFKRFVQLLWASNGKEREVSYFASQMCITPKYLSVIVRESCGKTPLQMIHTYVTNMIAQRLRNTDLSIKEIARELNFPNESFFGRFCKRQLGCPPGKYREEANGGKTDK